MEEDAHLAPQAALLATVRNAPVFIGAIMATVPADTLLGMVSAKHASLFNVVYSYCPHRLFFSCFVNCDC